MTPNQSGNVLVYILLAVALLAALTYAVSRDGGGNQVNQLTDAEAELQAIELITQANAAQMAVDQMMQWGVAYDEILFNTPDEAGFTSNTSRQVYHPSGGGLKLFPPEKLFNDNEYWNNTTNVEWTPTSDNDLIYSITEYSSSAETLESLRAICSKINELIIGDPAIPEVPANFYEQIHFDYGEYSHNDFTSSDCPQCLNKQSACFYESPGTWNGGFVFYKILKAN